MQNINLEDAKTPQDAIRLAHSIIKDSTSENLDEKAETKCKQGLLQTVLFYIQNNPNYPSLDYGVVFSLLDWSILSQKIAEVRIVSPEHYAVRQYEIIAKSSFDKDAICISIKKHIEPFLSSFDDGQSE